MISAGVANFYVMFDVDCGIVIEIVISKQLAIKFVIVLNCCCVELFCFNSPYLRNIKFLSSCGISFVII